MRKMEYNKPTDKEQFERYKNVIGDVTPETLEAFQELKYGEPKEWGQLKYEYRTVNRYDVNGDLSTDKIIELDNAAWYTKQKGFDYSTLTGDEKDEVKKLSQNGNAAVMELDGSIYFSHSRMDDKKGLCMKSYIGKYTPIGLSENRVFNVLDLGDGVERQYDTEAKFLEFVAQKKDPQDSFGISILSEKHICKSCEGVIEQFKRRYPKAVLNIASGKSGYNKDPNGRKTWKYRKKV